MNVLESIMKSVMTTTKQQNADREGIIRENYKQASEVRRKIMDELQFLSQYGCKVQKGCSYGDIRVDYPCHGGDYSCTACLKLPFNGCRVLGKYENLYDVESKSLYVDWNYNMCHNDKDDQLTLEQFIEKLAKKMV